MQKNQSNPNHYWEKGQLFLKNKQFKAAKQEFSRLCELRADNADSWVQLGLVEERLNEHKAAFKCYQKAIGLDSKHIQGLFRLGNLFALTGKNDKAYALLSRALRIQPAFVDAQVALGGVHKAVGRLGLAEKCFREVLKLAPDEPHALNGLADVFRKQGRYREAIKAYEKLHNANVDFPGVRDKLAAFYSHINDSTHAEVILREQVLEKPKDLEAICNFSSVLLLQGKLEEAITVLESLGVEQRKDLSWKLNHGKVLAALGKYSEAAESFESAKASEPDRYWKYVRQFAHGRIFDDTVIPDLFPQRSHTEYWIKRWKRCDWRDYQAGINSIKANIDRWICSAAVGYQAPPVNPFDSLTIDIGENRQAAMVRAYSRFIDRAAKKISGKQQFVHLKKERARGKLKIGYLSPDLRDHPVGILLEKLFQTHDRKKFSVYTYSTRNDDASEIARSIKESSDRFTDLAEHSNFEAASRIFNDRLDILVDLAGYTTLARPEILAFRPAPVQVHYIGCPGPMNAPFYDYRFVSPVLLPTDQDANYDEKIVRVNHCFHYVSGHRDRCEATTRKKHGLPEDALVYCCFNSPKRIDPVLFSVWMEILHGVPGSVLWLRDWGRDAKDNLIREANARGISPARLIFSPDLPLDEHLARLPLADLYLDTRIYSGFTMLTMALWQKLPVITMRGDTFISRLGASAVHEAGVPDLCVSDLNAYKELAIAIGTDRQRLESVRSRMENVRDSNLFDRDGATRRLESAYVEIARRYNAGEEPESFDVE